MMVSLTNIIVGELEKSKSIKDNFGDRTGSIWELNDGW